MGTGALYLTKPKKTKIKILIGSPDVLLRIPPKFQTNQTKHVLLHKCQRLVSVHERSVYNYMHAYEYKCKRNALYIPYIYRTVYCTSTGIHTCIPYSCIYIVILYVYQVPPLAIQYNTGT